LKYLVPEGGFSHKPASQGSGSPLPCQLFAGSLFAAGAAGAAAGLAALFSLDAAVLSPALFVSDATLPSAGFDSLDPDDPLRE
jgi:hypothetical protein